MIAYPILTLISSVFLSSVRGQGVFSHDVTFDKDPCEEYDDKMYCGLDRIMIANCIASKNPTWPMLKGNFTELAEKKCKGLALNDCYTELTDPEATKVIKECVKSTGAHSSGPTLWSNPTGSFDSTYCIPADMVSKTSQQICGDDVAKVVKCAQGKSEYFPFKEKCDASKEDLKGRSKCLKESMKFTQEALDDCFKDLKKIKEKTSHGHHLGYTRTVLFMLSFTSFMIL